MASKIYFTTWKERAKMRKKIERQTLHLFLQGELDMNNANDLKISIDTDIEKRGVRTIVFHMDDLKFIDSSGLGVILGRYKKLAPLGGKIQIRNVPAHLYKIMELSGLPKIIEFLPENKSKQKDPHLKGEKK